MTSHSTPFQEFLARLSLLIEQHPLLMVNTLSNVFTMRLIGNKTHGDLGEIAIAEFIRQFMYDYDAQHVGKDLFRAKEHEEDIVVSSLINHESIAISLKAYGDGPLQLSTDKTGALFPYLSSFGTRVLSDSGVIAEVFSSAELAEVMDLNVLPLIYREKSLECNIMVFDIERAMNSTSRIELVDTDGGRGRKHPIWKFSDSQNRYICDVRYGGAAANALQRGLWTHTRNAEAYFTSVTGGWISYAHNLVLVDLFAKALNATQDGHRHALEVIEGDLGKLRRHEGLPA